MAQRDIYLGREIGNYHIEQELASGSFGTVYLARHLHLKQRTVVIKILHAIHLGSDEEKEQFLQEAQILETLKGLPNILPLLDVGIDGNVPYMIAEYAEHGSLRMYMRQHGIPVPVQEAQRIIEQVGHGLENAHNQGIVHRDLKPENILFNAKDEAMLADFGIATTLSTSSVTHTRIEGTPAYMAPEQFQGEVSKESDQYALACIAYELLTGHKPFEAPNSVAMGFLHTTKPPTPPRQLNPQIPASVEHALLRALSKERTERYPSISAFVASLSALDDPATLLLAQRPPTLPTSPSTLPETSNSLTLPPPSTIPGMPTRALNPSVSGMTTTPAMYNPIVSETDPSMPAYPAGPVWSPPPSPMPPANRNRSAPLVIALVIVMLLVLGGSGLAALAYFGLSQAYFGPSNPQFGQSNPTAPLPSATITITPVSTTVQDTYTMRGVTGNANPDNREVSVRQLTSTKTTTDTATATGVGHIAAASAAGTLTFQNGGASYDLLAGTVFNGPNGVAVSNDKFATVPAVNLNTGTLGQITVNAHAVNPGRAGNIPSGAINTSCCRADGSIRVISGPFSGGQDALNYKFLQQSDVDKVTTAHQDTLKSNAQNDINSQIKSFEKLLGDINCQTSTDTAGKPVGDKAENVTSANVTVSVTCNAQVYDANAIQTIAGNELKQKASKDPGAGYMLAGNIVTQAQQPQVQQDGSITFQVTASGIWYYQWTDAMKQDLLNKIKGKSKAQAQAILNSYLGVGSAKIDISNGGTTLPGDVRRIKLVVNTVNGL